MNDATPEGSAQGLHALEAEVRRDLARLNYPAAAWLPGPETGMHAATDPQADTDPRVESQHEERTCRLLFVHEALQGLEREVQRRISTIKGWRTQIPTPISPVEFLLSS